MNATHKPRPPPAVSRRRRSAMHPKSNHEPASLDSGSELSELTEDEQDSARTGGLEIDIRKQPTRRTPRALIPDQMWGWYKKKPLSDENSEPYNDDGPDKDLGSAQAPHEQPQQPQGLSVPGLEYDKGKIGGHKLDIQRRLDAPNAPNSSPNRDDNVDERSLQSLSLDSRNGRGCHRLPRSRM